MQYSYIRQNSGRLNQYRHIIISHFIILLCRDQLSFLTYIIRYMDYLKAAKYFKWNFKLRNIPVGDQIPQQRTYLSFPARQLSPIWEPFPQDQALQHLIFQIAFRTSPTVGTRRHCCLCYAPNSKNLENVHVSFLHKIRSCLCVDYKFQNKASFLYPFGQRQRNRQPTRTR